MALLNDLATQLRIGNQWRNASDGTTFDVTDPGNGDVVASVADGSPNDAVDAVAAAHQASSSWAATSPRERSELLRAMYESMTEHADELAELITRESGKALQDSRSEVTYAAEFFRWFAEEAPRARGWFSNAPAGDKRIVAQLQPVGVSILITPWNFPAAMATRKIGAALAAGCTTVIKPAQATPLSTLMIARLFELAGVPDGVVNVVTTTNAQDITQAMLDDHRVRKVSFTGSTSVGSSLLTAAAPRALRASMELGGNAPFIVLEDANVNEAVDAALVAKFRNGGQSCVAANRFYVHTSIYHEFCETFGAAASRLPVGYGLDDGVKVASMISASARADVVELTHDALLHGARCVTSSDFDGPDGFMPPTVLADVPTNARCMHEEIFGPLAPISQFDDVDDVVIRANDTPFGLAAYVCGPLDQALAVADRVDAGMVGINRGLISDTAAPFGGWKSSGIGREGAHEGLLEYLETKYITLPSTG